MALAYCNDCQTTHPPHQHRSRRPRHNTTGRHSIGISSGGRHLATSPPIPAARALRIRLEVPPAEEIGERLAGLWGTTFTWLRETTKKAWDASGRVVDAASPRLEDTWRKVVDFSGLHDGPQYGGRHGKRPRPSGPNPLVEPPQRVLSVSATGVGVMEYSPSRDHLLEVSMLESLGFYDPENTVVVAVTTPPPAQHAVPTPPRAASQPLFDEALTARAPLIPDLDLHGWRPHVIARSKLGPGSWRPTTIGILTLTLLIGVTLVVGLVRRPQTESARIRQSITVEAGALGTALTALQSDLDAVSEFDATASLLEVDRTARAFFQIATELRSSQDDDLRSAATEISHQALQLENRVTEALSYQLVLGSLWRSPNLSAVEDATEAAELLAPWQAEVAKLVATLPEGADLGTHAGAVERFAVELPSWATNFLDSLAVGDTAAAEAALESLEAKLAGLAHDADSTVAGVITDARSQAGALVADIDRLIARSGG